MPKYIYKAKNLAGEEKSGSLDAENEHELSKVLHQDGYLLIRADIEEKKRKVVFSLSSFRKVSLVSKLMFIRNLRVMVSAGVSLPRAFSILAEQTKSKKLINILLETREKVLRGKALSDSLSDYPDVFSNLFIGMIKVGEETGKLEDVLAILSKQMEKDYQLKSRLKSAMVYPMVIIFAMVVIGILMLILVIPKLADVFEEMGVELPLTTRIIIIIGSFMAEFWYLLPIVIIGGAFLVKLLLKTKTGKIVSNTVSLKMPLVGPIVKKTNSAYTIRTLSSLISAGVPIVNSLEIISNSLANIYYKNAIRDASEKVRKGAKLGESLKEYSDIYPNLVIQMIEVGEETGETSEILEKLSEFYEEEVTAATKNLSAVIEPILMLIIGAAVAFFAISMIQPIYGMVQTL